MCHYRHYPLPHVSRAAADFDCSVGIDLYFGRGCIVCTPTETGVLVRSGEAPGYMGIWSWRIGEWGIAQNLYAIFNPIEAI